MARPQEKPDAAAKASPLTFVSKDDAPVLTFQGTKDPLVPYNQAIKLADAMTAAGVPGRVELLVGAQHGWAGAELERTINETFRFFDPYLEASRPPATRSREALNCTVETIAATRLDRRSRTRLCERRWARRPAG